MQAIVNGHLFEIGILADFISGLPYSPQNAMPILDGYGLPQIATWNNATTLNTALTSGTNGMDCVAITIVPTGSITGGAISFEVYDGANWVPIKCARESSYNTDSTYQLNGITTIQGWTIPAAAFPQARARLSTAITGTGSVLITSIVSSAPDTSVVTAGLDPLQAMHPGVQTIQAAQVVTVGGSSVQSAVVQATTNRVTLSSTTGCWVAFGASPTASAASGSIYVPPNAIMLPVAVTPGVTKIAVIQASAAGTLSIIESL